MTGYEHLTRRGLLIILMPIVTVIALVIGLAGFWLILSVREQRDQARGCALANVILAAIDVNRLVLEDTLETLQADRAEAAAAAEADGELADAARRAGAARRYALLAQRLQPIRQFDCQED